MTSSDAYFYSNRMGRILLQAMDEILGQNGVNTILQMADLPRYINNYPAATAEREVTFTDISQLQAGLEKAYGIRSGRGLAQRVGHASFKYVLREFGPELALNDLGFRLQPVASKVRIGSQALADLFNKFTDQQVRLERDEKTIYWIIERCPLCWGRHPDAGAPNQGSGPCCHMAVGLLQEALYWLSAGRQFEVKEDTCIACGDSSCTISINQTPMS